MYTARRWFDTRKSAGNLGWIHKHCSVGLREDFTSPPSLLPCAHPAAAALPLLFSCWEYGTRRATSWCLWTRSKSATLCFRTCRERGTMGCRFMAGRTRRTETSPLPTSKIRRQRSWWRPAWRGGACFSLCPVYERGCEDHANVDVDFGVYIEHTLLPSADPSTLLLV